MRAPPSNSSTGWGGRRHSHHRVESVHVAAYIEQLQKGVSAPTAKLRLRRCAICSTGLLSAKYAGESRRRRAGPRHIVRRGKTPGARSAGSAQLIDAIEPGPSLDLRRPRAYRLMVYSFARIGAAIGMRVEDVYSQNRRLWVRCTRRAASSTPCRAITILKPTCTNISTARGWRASEGVLFQTYSRATGQLTGNPLPQANAMR